MDPVSAGCHHSAALIRNLAGIAIVYPVLQQPSHYSHICMPPSAAKRRSKKSWIDSAVALWGGRISKSITRSAPEADVAPEPEDKAREALPMDSFTWRGDLVSLKHQDGMPTQG